MSEELNKYFVVYSSFIDKFGTTDLEWTEDLDNDLNIFTEDQLPFQDGKPPSAIHFIKVIESKEKPTIAEVRTAVMQTLWDLTNKSAEDNQNAG